MVLQVRSCDPPLCFVPFTGTICALPRRKLGRQDRGTTHSCWFVLDFASHCHLLGAAHATMTSDQMSRISLINYFGNDGPLGFLELENADEEEVNPGRQSQLSCTAR